MKTSSNKEHTKAALKIKIYLLQYYLLAYSDSQCSNPIPGEDCIADQIKQKRQAPTICKNFSWKMSG